MKNIKMYDSKTRGGTSLAVQWLGLLPTQGVRVQPLASELRPHLPSSQNTKT